MALRFALQAADHAVYEAPDAATAVDMLRLAWIPLVMVVSLAGAESKPLDLILAGDATLTPHTSIVVCPEAGRLPASLANLFASRGAVITNASLDLNALLALVGRSLVTLTGATGACEHTAEHAPARDQSTA